MCVVLLPAAALALPLDHFTIIVPATAPAGSGFGITIVAKDSTDAIIYDFTGTVSLRVTLGTNTITAYSPTVSQTFDGTQWTGTMTSNTAGTITITCSTGGTLNATGSADLTVIPQSYTQSLLVFPGQIYTPGVPPGVTPLLPTAMEGIPYTVTVYAVDQFFNWDTNTPFVGNINLQTAEGTVSLPGAGGVPTGATQTATTDGHALFNVSFSILGPGIKSLTSTTPYSRSWQVNVFQNEIAYLHVIAPTVVTAGVPFPLTVNASASSTDPNMIVSSLRSSDTFRLNAYQAGGMTPVTGTWEPTDPKGLEGGKYLGTGRYTRAEIIHLFPEQVTAPSGVTLTGIDSNGIDVQPNIPAKVQVSVQPGWVQSHHTARVTARVLDTWDNPTWTLLHPAHPFVVVFEQTAGNGSLSVSMTATDNYGYAHTDYTGGIVNETATVRARVWHPLLGYDYASGSTTVRVSVAEATPGSIVNFPNPFNPAKGQTTAVNYCLDSASDVEVRIFDPFGRLVLSRDLKADGTDDASRNATAAGGNTFVWDGKNGEGRVVANGIYLFRLKARGGGTTQEFSRRVGVQK